ncbi:MAG: hypothetical protein Q4D62_12900 [Planctomycetia bacterium]|nr:hypothetical protein [Planctomycetia bacterium]
MKNVWGWSCLFSLVLAGCGGDSHQVSWEGTVTIEGKPLPENLRVAVIQVRPMREIPGVAPVQAEIVDSQFFLSGIPKGKVWVTLIIEQKTGKIIREKYAPEYEEVVNIVPPSKRNGFAMEVMGNERKMVLDLKK